MVRVGGLHYAIDPQRDDGRAHHADGRSPASRSTPAKKYKVAGWAPVSEEAKAAGGEPIWDVVARYLRAQKTIAPRALNLPQVEGVGGQSRAWPDQVRNTWEQPCGEDVDADRRRRPLVAGGGSRPRVAQKMLANYPTLTTAARMRRRRPRLRDARRTATPLPWPSSTGRAAVRLRDNLAVRTRRRRVTRQ